MEFFSSRNFVLVPEVVWGYPVAKFDRALRYKPEGRGFDTPSGPTLTLGLTQPLTEISPGGWGDGWSKCGRCIKLTNLPPSCADHLEQCFSTAGPREILLEFIILVF